jgi:hypothetical protein
MHDTIRISIRRSIAAMSELSLQMLPLDIQVGVLAFLRPVDLAVFMSVSRQSRNIAVVDRLWSPLLTRQLADVMSYMSPTVKPHLLRIFCRFCL